jgi:hypothetical protein
MKFRLIEEYIFEDIEAVRKYYPNISKEDFNRIIALDPTFHREQDKLGTYGKWILSLFQNGNLKNEGHVKDILMRFENEKKNLKNKDIMTYKSLEDLDNALNDENSYKDETDRQKLRKTQDAVRKSDLSKEAEKVYEDKDWEVWIPHTYEASCKLGRGTQWCTATTESDHYYKQYTNEGKLYININKKNSEEKYQFHFESKSFMDEQDESIDIINFFVDNPNLFDFYKNIINSDIQTEDGYEIVPTASFILDNPSDTFIYQKDNAKLFDTYGVWLSERIKHLIIDNSITKILWMSFANFENLETVEISDSVTSIGDSAFYGCSSLTSITIPDSVTSIGSEAFIGCSKLTSITIPDSVVSIGENAFGSCMSLKNIVLPNNITNISNGMLANCGSLINIVIPDSVTIIGEWAFEGCRSLRNITIPNSVKNIGEYAFRGCTNIEKVYYKGTREQFKLIDIDQSNGDLGYGDILFIGE